MDKIDFFGGCHGNFLEVVLDMFVYDNQTMLGKNLFNSNGACHQKNEDKDYSPSIIAKHFSYNKIPFDNTDKVIEIHVEADYMLIALTNSLLRAGDEVLDISNLNEDTLKKLLQLPKARGLHDTLIAEHGVQKNYPRQVLRNYFYSKFDNPKYGVELFNTFNHNGPKHVFPFSAFFDLQNFYVNLNKCAFFVNLDFCPTIECAKVWFDFVAGNQGYQSFTKCKTIIASILDQSNMNIENLNLLEEAWICYQVAKIFRCYDHPLLIAESFPTNTYAISKAIYDWKSK